ncbi:unnamed protein product [Staurois parvus]|uniref:Uncharacterized protein n=1 Tax=Staurois parvus TaxID=386267 RepID=A0ABN9FCP8_9NEOB|nr:unnamed protein product [Staurois parvus]
MPPASATSMPHISAHLLPPNSASQCRLSVPYMSVPFSAHQCCLSKPISATYQCLLISATYQCPSVQPISAHHCSLISAHQ